MTDPFPSATNSRAGAESHSPAVPHNEATSMRTVVSSSLIGTTIEWFDFFAYSTAAALCSTPCSSPPMTLSSARFWLSAV